MLKSFSKYLLLLPLILLSISSFGQKVDMELKAKELYGNGEYDEAIKIYKQLFNKSPRYSRYYNNLLEAFTTIKRYDSADSLIDTKKKLYPYNPNYFVDKGYIAKKRGDKSKSENYYKKALELVAATPNMAYSTSNQFQIYQEPEWALKTYKTAEKVNPRMNFAIQKANLFGELGMVDSMLSNYFIIVEKQPARKGTIKRYLQTFLKQNPSQEMSDKVRNALVSKVQATDEPAFSEILLWYYTENKQYGEALDQAKSLFKRNFSSLNIIQNLGEDARKNKQYTNAVKCFEYVISQDSISDIFYAATKSLLAMQAEMPRKSISEDQIIKTYESAIANKTKSAGHFNIILSYAKYQAYQLNNTEMALQILEKETAPYAKYSNIIAKKYLLEGDIYLLKQDFTKSFLSYQKAETWSEDSYLADEAKFKGVKVAFYKGDFKWALGQAKVLKKSVSKWYANDSAELLITLQNSYNSDSSEVALKLYARADLLKMQGKTDSSYAYFDQIIKSFPSHYLVPTSLYSQAEILKSKMAFNRCIETLKDLYLRYPSNNLAPFALLNISEVYLQNLKNKDEAKVWLEELLKKFPDSPIANDARNIYQDI